MMNDNLAYPNKCELCGNTMKELDEYYEKYSMDMLAKEQKEIDEAKEAKQAKEEKIGNKSSVFKLTSPVRYRYGT